LGRCPAERAAVNARRANEIQVQGAAMKPTHGTLDGCRIELHGEAFNKLTPREKARIEVDFGYGLVRPYRQLLETIDDQLGLPPKQKAKS
jgi:hypothetical protein